MPEEIIQLIMTIPAALGFALFFNLRPRLLASATFGGFLSWSVYLIFVKVIGGIFWPCLIASAISALYAELLARHYRAPSSIFFIITVIPLIPGRGLFYTMSSAVRMQWADFYSYGMTTLQYAAAIAIGISSVWAIAEILSEARDRKFWQRISERGHVGREGSQSDVDATDKHELAQSKGDMRAKLLERRDELDPIEMKDIDVKIQSNLIDHGFLDGVDFLLTYISVGSECSTDMIVAYALEHGIDVMAPKCDCDHKTMDWYKIKGPSDLKTTHKWLKEPDPDACELVTADAIAHMSEHDSLCVVAGLAFDERGNRIGYGGGYFDRFLASYCGMSVGLCRSGFFLDKISCMEPHDVAVDAVVTEDEVLIISKTS